MPRLVAVPKQPSAAYAALGEEVVNELKCALEPLKLAVDALCRKNATLLAAEEIFQFLFF